MTNDEVKYVLAAWEADPECRPPQVTQCVDGFQVAWGCCDPGWAAQWWNVDERTMPAVMRLIHASLHLRLLELGAHVQPASGGFGVWSASREGSLSWSASPISAMSRAIVAMAKERTDGEHARRAEDEIKELLDGKRVTNIRTIIQSAIDAANAELRKELEECRAVLREDLQWSVRDLYDRPSACPICYGHYRHGHAPDCRLARLLGDTP